MTPVTHNLAAIKQQIHDYENRYGRQFNSVALLAVSKGQPVDKIVEAVQAGQLAFGENYFQEAINKISLLHHLPLKWHFIGSIQSNKAKKIAEHFDWVDSVSSIAIATKLNKHRSLNRQKLNICLQVNISEDSSKQGIKPNDLLEIARFCSTLPHLQLRGLMTIPTPKEQFLKQRAEYNKLRLLFDFLNNHGFQLDTLSMGMSQDMGAAIAENATIVRIGTALFGPRNAPP